MSPEGATRVSVIIVDHDDSPLLLNCLVALSHVPDELGFEVVVVDNGSQETTAKLLESVEGDLQTIRYDRPTTRSRALDEAARRAKGDYLCFLREDSHPVDGWLEALVAVLDRDPKIGAVSTRTTDADGRKRVDSLWSVLTVRREAYDDAGGFAACAQPGRWYGFTFLHAIATRGWKVQSDADAVVLVGTGARR